MRLQDAGEVIEQLVRSSWDQYAAYAWWSYQKKGRIAVRIAWEDIETMIHTFLAHPEQPPPVERIYFDFFKPDEAEEGVEAPLLALIRDYNPEQSFVLVVWEKSERGVGLWWRLMQGLPTPPEASRMRAS